MADVFPYRWTATLAVLLSVAVLALHAVPAIAEVGCTNGLKTALASDPAIRVVLVKGFLEGSDLTLDGVRSDALAGDDLCLVKLIVGPGNPGPTHAPSTSAGIGVEVWLPSPRKWNKRLQMLGGGGFFGNPAVISETHIGVGLQMAELAAREGYVFTTTDGGHVADFIEPQWGPSSYPEVNGSFAMLPDGGINTALWKDFASRATHQAIVKTKVLVEAYYGEAARYAYFTGCSGGGRQGHAASQTYPDDFNGILIGNSAIGWAKFAPYELYPQIAMLRDLGAPLTQLQLDLVSAAAVSACDTTLNGDHDGFISDPEQCRYDPTRDPQVLCKSDGGKGVPEACVTRRQANVFNKIWYGQTADGSAPSPRKSIGSRDRLEPGQLWFGLPRGVQLHGIPAALANSTDGVAQPFLLGLHQVALNLQDPSIADPTFLNATSNGQDRWKSLSYADLARAHHEGVRLQAAFGNVDADDPDLSAFRLRQGKMIEWGGTADQLYPFQATLQHYRRVAEKMGGLAAAQDFYRLYPIAGMGHCFGTSANGLTGISPAADPFVPERSSVVATRSDQLFAALVDWVEKGQAPGRIEVSNGSRTKRRPLCAYPARIAYSGGDRDKASSYYCR